MFNASLILDTDSYKASHWMQYPEGVTENYAYFEARGGDYTHTVFFGLQYILKEYLCKPITREMVDEAAALFKAHGEPFNRDGWMHIVEKHNGYLPLRIKAVPEGTVVRVKNVLMTVENTDPACAWLTSYVETLLSRLWYPCTVATRSWFCRKIIKASLDRTSDNPETEINFKLHDFGSRGCTSREQAAIGGAAHLISFLGTDTVVALPFLTKYYGAETAGFSIPASEHSIITSYGKDGEIDAYRNMIAKYGNNPIFACVSDSYNIYTACSELWGGALRKEVQQMPAILVVRPDSGHPPEVVLKVAQILDEKFGSALNTKGFKVLNKVRIIQGDGMDQDMIREVYNVLEKHGFAADNLAVGMGAGLLQKLNRDTCKFAYKTSYMTINGKGVDVYKEPVTDPGKKSKRGKLSLRQRVLGVGEYETIPYNPYGDMLVTVYENGQLKQDWKLEEIRTRAAEV